MRLPLFPMIRRLFVAVLVPGLLLTACTGPSPTARPRERPAESPSPTPTPPPPPPIAPLTGLKVASASIVRRPALAVKIDNHTDARPQVGLERADVVYEEPVEGGITRFIAIYQSQDASKVGPVRSARLTDIDVLAEYGRPLLAFSGAASYVLRGVRRANLVSLPHGAHGSIYRRDSSRWRSPHNLFTSTGGLYRAGRRRRPTAAPRLLTFGGLPPAPPAPAPAATASPTASPSPVVAAWPAGKRVIVPFGGPYNADWRYVSRQGRYLRWSGSARHRGANGDQIQAANVIVMRVTVSSRNRQASRHGTPQLRLVGQGDAVLLRGGVRIVGRWSHASSTAPTVFTDKLGRPFVFAPGNTWIELVPTRITPRYPS